MNLHVYACGWRECVLCPIGGGECESVYVTCMRRVYLWMGKGGKHVTYILIRSLSLCVRSANNIEWADQTIS